MARRIGDNAVDRAQMLLDVHRYARPCVRIAGIGTKTHRGRSGVVESLGHDTHRSAGGDARPGHVRQRGILSADDDHPSVEVVSHVHSVQFRR